MKPWNVKESTYVMHDQWIKVRSDTCETPNGVVLDPYYVLEYPDWVFVAAFDADMRLLVIRLYRHGVGDVCVEIPGGVIESAEKPEDAARRELREETGCEAGRLVQLGSLSPNSATHSNRVHCFVAYDCKQVAAPNQDAEEQIEHQFIDVSTWLERVESGGFFQALHIATVFMALRHAGLLVAKDASLIPTDNR